MFLLSVDGENFAEYKDPNEDEDFFVDVVEEIRAEHTHISYHSRLGLRILVGQFFTKTHYQCFLTRC